MPDEDVNPTTPAGGGSTATSSSTSIPASCPYARVIMKPQQQQQNHQQQPQASDDSSASDDTSTESQSLLPLPPGLTEWKQCPAFAAAAASSASDAAKEEHGDRSIIVGGGGGGCPFKGATSPQEISQTLSKIPPSHFGLADDNDNKNDNDPHRHRDPQQQHAFMKTLAYFHTHTNGHGGAVGAATSPEAQAALTAMTTSGEGGIALSRCPVKPFLPPGVTLFDVAMEEFSWASLMSKLVLLEQRDKEDEVTEGKEQQHQRQPMEDKEELHPTDDSLQVSHDGNSDAMSPTKQQQEQRTFVTSKDTNQRCLSDALKSGTAQAHESAESVHFVKNFIKGKIDRDLYALLVAQLFHVYRRLEQALEKHAPQHFAACHFPDELNRTAALQEDVEFWHSDLKEGTEPSISPATQDYLDRIDYLAATDPLLLLAHAYTRYLGDLSGGKILARVARRALQLDKLENGRSGEGLRFYDFDKISSFKRFKDMYRQSLNDLPLGNGDDGGKTEQEQMQAIVQEANVAFLLNMRLFEELDVLGGVPGASVRPLESVYVAAAETTVESTEEEPLSNGKKIPPECPFAKTANGTEMTPSGQAHTKTTKKNGTCPWPFILLHDPRKGMQKWQTWIVLGLVLACCYNFYLGVTSGFDGAANQAAPSVEVFLDETIPLVEKHPRFHQKFRPAVLKMFSRSPMFKRWNKETH